MRFTFTRAGSGTTHFLTVGPRGVSLINNHSIGLCLSYAAGSNGVRLEMDLTALRDNLILTDSARAQKMLVTLNRYSGGGWIIDESTQVMLRATQSKPATGPTLDPERALDLIDRLVMAIGTHAPHLMTGDVDVQAAHALLVKHGRWAPPPPPAKAQRARRARKAPAAA